MKLLFSTLIALLLFSCASSDEPNNPAIPESAEQANLPSSTVPVNELTLVVLGIAQDAGYPQANCEKSCCQAVWSGDRAPQKVVSLGVIDPEAGQFFLFEATPDFTAQWEQLKALSPPGSTCGGIFLTHAHVGHYTGLMYLGHEAMGAHGIPVYAMPQMQSFLESNGPWSQLTAFDNIVMHSLADDSTISLTPALSVKPRLVPHRDEFSETVGFEIIGSNKRVLFIPDIDKWSKWDQSLTAYIRKVDRAYLDATFYAADELPGRNMAEIPHPFVPETLALIDSLPDSERKKVHLIHFNHTNALLESGGRAEVEVLQKGVFAAREGDRMAL